MVSFCPAHQEGSNSIHFDLLVTLRSRDLISTVDLDLMICYDLMSMASAFFGYFLNWPYKEKLGRSSKLVMPKFG